ncbi:hypothetical protein [Acetonema longum]|uniref:Uncharacterized protein n=1 Tax=Acetonema longum DSM 6540 TaxID=1009370 RepID=F7NNK1_9FIRM|nr:hypothetical protein [Acetonema longum]EGO62382.1 hypothetical protein ALO_18462 [Acetonema longum DSM 6540]
MSVYAYILNAENDFEKSLSTPVAVEKFFNEFWLPAAEELGLKWIPTFSAGMDVTKEDVSEILDELSRLKKWAKKHQQMSQDDRTYMISRIELLEERLPQAFRRENAVMFIG